jgi:hypothetical protein
LGGAANGGIRHGLMGSEVDRGDRDLEEWL